MLRYIILPLLLMLSSVSFAMADGSPVSPVNLDFSVALPAVDPSVVLRQQQIEINSVQLANNKTKTIHFDLFDNVKFDIFLTKQGHTPKKNIVRQGKIVGYPNSTVLFIINGSDVTGELSFSNTLYHIRTIDHGIYIAQEINTVDGETQITGKTANRSTDDVITLTNQERAKYGLPALAYNSQLTQAAQGHADDMARNNYFTHDSQDGRTFSQRITAAGYTWNSDAENIAAGQATATIVVNDWINSSVHHQNMLKTDVCDIGIGYAYNTTADYKYYWVQDFGRKRGVTSCPPVTPVQSTKKPDVVSGAATRAGTNSMKLTGTVNPNGLATEYYFELGYTTAYGVTSPHYSAGAGTSPLSVVLTPSGFSPDITYHYRVVASNSKGTSYGRDVAFRLNNQQFPIAVLSLLLSGSTPESAITTISSTADGSIAIPSGAAIQVTAGTVPKNQGGNSAKVTFSIESPVQAPAPLGDGGRLLGDLVKYGPEGFTFRWPVKMTLPIPAGIDPYSVVVVHYDEVAESWKRMIHSGIDTDNRLVSFDALKLGIYGLATFSSSSKALNWAKEAGSRILKTGNTFDCEDGVIFKIMVPPYSSPPYSYAITINNVFAFRYPGQAYLKPQLIGQMATPGEGRKYIGYIASQMHLPQATYTFCLTRMSNYSPFAATEVYNKTINVTTDRCLQYPFLENPDNYKEILLSDFTGGRWVTGTGCNWPTPTKTYGTGNFEATLTWVNNTSHTTDLDLHLYGPNGMHVYWNNPVSSDGSVHKDRDWMETPGEATENIYNEDGKTMPAGNYVVKVRYYSGDNVDFNVRIINSGQKTINYRGRAQSVDSYTTIGTFTK